MTKRCLCPAAVCFLLGIVFSVKETWLAILPFILLSFYAALRFYRYDMTVRGIVFAGVLTASFLAGILIGDHNKDLRETYLAVLKDGQQIKVSGRLYKKEDKRDRICLYLDKGRILLGDAEYPCRDIMVETDSADHTVGNILVVSGRYKEFSTARNEGNYDEREYNYGRGVDICVSKNVDIIEYGKEKRFRESLYELREKMKEVMNAALSESGAGTLSAMVLGDKTSLLAEDKSLFSEAGLSHILSVSGLHISLLCMGLFALLRKLHLSVIPASLAASVFAVIYCLFTGENTATIRAVGMFLISMTAMATGEAYDIITSLSVLAVVVSTANPMVIFTAGFTLSFGAVLGIAVTGRELSLFFQLLVRRKNAVRLMKRRLREKEKKAASEAEGPLDAIFKKTADAARRFWESLFGTMLINAGIIVTTLPLMAWFYYEVPTLSVFVNLIVVPLMGILLCLGFAGALAGCAFYPAARLLLGPCDLILRYYKKVAELSGALPFSSWIIGKPSFAGIMIFYLLLAVFVVLLHCLRMDVLRDDEEEIKLRQSVRIPLFILIFITFTVLSAFVLRLSVFRKPQVVMLDVDQGDGIFIKTDSRQNVFIDGGSTGIKSVGRYRILPFLKSRGEGHIDYWFVSHADDDHVNGILEIVQEGYKVRNLVISAGMADDENAKRLKEAAARAGMKIYRMEPEDELLCGSDRFICLFPDEGYKPEDANGGSLVLLYETDAYDVLFTGDMGKKEEAELMKNMKAGPQRLFDGGKPVILKVAHHGSKNSSDEEFLKAVSPDAALISAGVNNSYGHPHRDTLDKLEKIGAPIYRTDESKEIKVFVKDGKINVSGL